MAINVLPFPRLVKVGPSIVERLATLRRELETTTEIIDMEVSAGLLLFDVCAALGLGPDERREVLGEKAEADIQAHLNSTVTLREQKAPRGTGRSKQAA